MNGLSTRILGTTVLMIAVLLGKGAAAQQVRDGGGDTARFQVQIQQLTLERSELETQNRELETELESRASDLEAAQGRIQELESRVAALEASLQQSNSANTRSQENSTVLRQRLDEVVAEFRQTIEVLRMTEIELDETSAALASMQSDRDSCVAHNLSLYETGIEVLDRYEEKGCFESVRQSGPFIQLKRVELENLVDGYRWQLEDELLPENAAPE